MSWKQKAVFGVTALAVGAGAVAYGPDVMHNVFNDASAYDTAGACYLKQENGLVGKVEPIATIMSSERDGFDHVGTSQAVFKNDKGEMIIMDMADLKIGDQQVMDYPATYDINYGTTESNSEIVTTVNGGQAAVMSWVDSKLVFSDGEVPGKFGSMDDFDTMVSGISSNQATGDILPMQSQRITEALSASCEQGGIVTGTISNAKMDTMKTVLATHEAATAAQTVSVVKSGAKISQPS